MRNPLYSLLLAVLAATLLLGSCGLVGNGEKKKPTADSTFFRATLNGKSWSGKPKATRTRIAGLDWFQISGLNRDKDNYPYGEWLGFSLSYHGLGDYSLVRTLRNENQSLYSGSSYDEESGDAVISDYYPTEDSSANQLTITSYDSTTGIMEGTFHTTVVIEDSDRADPQRRQPDTLRFTNGKFRVKVEDRRDE